MKLKNYNVTDNKFWTGRIDDPNDIDSFRMHQIIQIIDITKPESLKLEPSILNICIIGFCCDEGVRRNLGRTGAKQGPEYIRKAFANLPVTFGKNTAIYDAGDIICIENNLEEAQSQLTIAIKIILENNFFPIVLGGGHEVAFGHYNGIISHFENNKNKNLTLGIINFDAHLDLRPHKDGGSSGTMFSQIADICSDQKRQFSYMCLGAQLCANTTSLFKKADLLHAKYILAKDFIEPNYKNILADIHSFIDKNEYIYLTICSDVFNSSFAPGVSAIQPLGMNAELVLIFLKEILKTNKVVSFDIAEVSPRFDQDNSTAKLAAVIIFALINVLNENYNNQCDSVFT